MIGNALFSETHQGRDTGDGRVCMKVGHERSNTMNKFPEI